MSRFEADPSLQKFFDAPDGGTADYQLGKLLTEVADPVIRRVLGGKFRVRLPAVSRTAASATNAPRDEATLDAEDTCSEAHGTLAKRLQAVRNEHRLGGDHGASSAPPIADFRGYVASVAFSSWVDYLRRRRPERARLLNRIRYLLEASERHTGLALWANAEGERLCGFRAWRDGRKPRAPEARRQALLADPLDFVRDAVFPGELRSVNPARLLAVIFDRLDGPVPLPDLLEAVAELWDIMDADAAALTPVEPAAPAEQIASALPTPHDAARWSEYLRWLWSVVGGLPMRQRAAFLLHSDVVKEFEYAGVASIRAVAGALEISPEDFAEFWSELPLSDDAIADRLGATRQQVINLRKAARIVLGRQLAVLLADPPAVAALKS